MNIAAVSAAACTVALLLKPGGPSPSSSVQRVDPAVFSEGGGTDRLFGDPSQQPAEIARRLAASMRARRLTPQTRVVCGMTVVTARPEVDPGMPVVHDSDIEHTIRTVQPPLCWEPADE